MSPPRILTALALGACLVGVVLTKLHAQASEWPGVDDSVINWLRGDMLLFAFLCAGLAAGFLLGFWGRALFVEQAGAPIGKVDDPP